MLAIVGSAIQVAMPIIPVSYTHLVYDKTGGYDFKGLRVVEMGRVKKFKPGKIEKSEGMEATVCLLYTSRCV